MSRPPWPDSNNSPSDIPGTIHPSSSTRRFQSPPPTILRSPDTTTLRRPWRPSDWRRLGKRSSSLFWPHASGLPAQRRLRRSRSFCRPQRESRLSQPIQRPATLSAPTNCRSLPGSAPPAAANKGLLCASLRDGRPSRRWSTTSWPLFTRLTSRLNRLQLPLEPLDDFLDCYENLAILKHQELKHVVQLPVSEHLQPDFRSPF